MPRAYEQGYDKGPLRINTLVDPVIEGGIDWTGGNVVYVPAGSSIATAITNAVSGDTIQLGAGTYAITSTLTVDKKLHIKGMGRGITTIASASDIHMLLATTQGGSLFSDLTLNFSAAMNISRYILSGTVAFDCRNVSIISTATGSSTTFSIGFYQRGAAITNLYDCSFEATGATGCNLGYYSSVSGSILNAFNCYGSSSGDTSGTYGGWVAGTNNTNATMRLYGGSFYSTVNQATGAVWTITGTLSVYNSTVNGSGATAFDVKRDAGTLTLYNTTLVNNKTSGTITYGGTVASSQINIGGTALNKTQLDALLELL